MKPAIWLSVLLLLLVPLNAVAEQTAQIAEADIAIFRQLRACCEEQGMTLREEAYSVTVNEGYVRYAWMLVEGVDFAFIYTREGVLAYYEISSPGSAEEYVKAAVLLIHCTESTPSITDASLVFEALLGALGGKAGLSTHRTEKAMYAFSSLPVTGHSIRVFLNAG